MNDGSKRRAPSLSGFEPALWLTERPEISEGRRALEGLLEFLHGHIEERLSGADTEEAVNERIDDLLDDEPFQNGVNIFGALYEEIETTSPQAIEEILDLERVRTMVPGDVETQTAYAEVPPLLTSFWSVAKHADFEYLPDSHSVAVRARVGIQVVAVCLHIIDAASHSEYLPNLITIAALKRISIELRDILRLWASLPGAVVSDELVPHETRYDLDQLRKEESLIQLNLSTMLSAAEASELDIFPPLGEDE